MLARVSTSPLIRPLRVEEKTGSASCSMESVTCKILASLLYPVTPETSLVPVHCSRWLHRWSVTEERWMGPPRRVDRPPRAVAAIDCSASRGAICASLLCTFCIASCPCGPLLCFGTGGRSCRPAGTLIWPTSVSHTHLRRSPVSTPSRNYIVRRRYICSLGQLRA